MRLWHLQLTSDDSGLHTALVLADDAKSASDALMHQASEDLGTLAVVGVSERPFTTEILDLDMPDPSAGDPGPPSVAGPAVYKVNWNDGLFHRSPGASLVSAPDAITALRLVLADDPFEGSPPYGVPPAFGPVVPFIVREPYVVAIYLEWPDEDD